MSSLNVYDKRSPIEQTYHRGESRHSSQFGDYTLYVNPVTRVKLICKEFTYNSVDMASAQIRNLDRLLSLTHPYLINIIDYAVHVEKTLCATVVTVRAFYEAPIQNFQNFLTNQKIKLNFMKVPMELLTHFMYQMVELNAWFQAHNIYHGNICPSTVMLDSIGTFKLLYKDNQTPERVQLEKLLGQEPIYMSPQLYHSFKIRKFDRVSHIPCKSDVFSLGMVILEAGLLHNIQCIYESDGSVNARMLTRYISEFSERYQENPLLYSSVKRMVEIDETARPDFNSLKAAMPPYDKIRAHFAIQGREKTTNNKSPGPNPKPPVNQEQNQRHENMFNKGLEKGFENTFEKAFTKTISPAKNNYGISNNMVGNNNPVKNVAQSDLMALHYQKVEQDRRAPNSLPNDSRRPQSALQSQLTKGEHRKVVANPSVDYLTRPPEKGEFTGRTRTISGKVYKEMEEERFEKQGDGQTIRKVVYVYVPATESSSFHYLPNRPQSNNTSFITTSLITANTQNVIRRPMSQNTRLPCNPMQFRHGRL